MRFAATIVGVAFGGFLAGYMGSREPHQSETATPEPSMASGKAEPSESRIDRQSPPPALLPAPDLLLALQPSVDSIARGQRILAALDALDGPAISALLSSPRSAELQRLIEEDDWTWRDPVLQRMMNRWMELDPAAARAWLPGAVKYFPRTTGGSLNDCLRDLLRPFAARFPEDAIAFALAMPPGWARTGAADVTIGAIVKNNPALARELIDRFPEGEAREGALAAYLIGSAKKDPLAAFEDAKALGEANARAMILESIDFSAWTPRQVEEFGEHLEPKEIASVLVTYARVNAAGASRLIERYATRPVMEKMAGDWVWLIGSWYGRSDGPAGIEWAGGLPEKIRGDAIRSVAKYWAAGDPAATVAKIAQLMPEGSARTDALKGAIGAWVEQDASAALRWLDSLPPGESRTELYAKALDTLPAVGLTEDALVRYSQIPPSDSAESRPGFAEMDLAFRDPRRLADWAAYFAGTGHSFTQVGEVVRNWFESDPDAAATWVTAQPASATRDQAAVECAIATSLDDADAAAEWLQWVSDPKVRSDSVKSISDILQNRDPAAAAAWIERFKHNSPR